MNDQVNETRSAASSRSLPNLVHLAARMRLITSSLAENDAPVERARSTDQGANSNMAGTPSEPWHCFCRHLRLISKVYRYSYAGHRERTSSTSARPLRPGGNYRGHAGRAVVPGGHPTV